MSSSNATAFRILNHLLINGKLDRHNEALLYSSYTEPEVYQMLLDFQEELDFTLLDRRGCLYLLPNQDNTLFGYNHMDLRNKLHRTANNKDLFLGYYIIMFIFYKFYSGRNDDPKRADFLDIGSIIEALDERIKGWHKLSDDKLYAKEEETALNLGAVANTWDHKIGHDEDSEGSIKTKWGMVLSVAEFLQNNELLTILDGRELRTTAKLDDIMRDYYLAEDRVQEIMSIFKDEGR